jgi:eukaryotic-like serine/threonine-protein kinase
MSGALGASVDQRSIVANRFVLVRPLEEGVDSATWLGRDQLGDNRSSSTPATHVVVKQLHQRRNPDDKLERILELQLLERRDQALAGLPRLLDHGWDGNQRYMVFEWCGDRPLADISAAELAKLPRAVRAGIARDLMRAMASVHEAGFLHLCLSPENVLINTATGTARLQSWGTMTPFAAGPNRLPAPITVAATGAPYASKELLAGAMPDPRDDVFAVACITYELLACTHPYRGRLAEIAAQFGWRPAALHSLTSHQHAVMMRALSLDRLHRSVTIDDLVDAFGEQPVPSPAAQPHSGTGVRGSRLALAITIIAGILLAYGAAQQFVNAGETPRTGEFRTIKIQVTTPTMFPSHPRVPAASKKALIAPNPEEAARLAADINKRVVSGPAKRSKTGAVMNVNETIIPLFESPIVEKPAAPLQVSAQPDPS